jgi:hypothetical protein
VGTLSIVCFSSYDTFLLAWRMCRAVKMHGSVVETTSSMTLSRSIREMDADTGLLNVHPE